MKDLTRRELYREVERLLQESREAINKGYYGIAKHNLSAVSNLLSRVDINNLNEKYYTLLNQMADIVNNELERRN